MSRERWVFAGILGILGFSVLALWLAPRAAERRAPQPVAAWVAIEEEGSGVARHGRVELVAGTSFQLHAVLEARDPGGDSVYYTEAPALELDGELLPSDALRRWPEHRRARVLWFTLEGLGPYLTVREEADLQRFDLDEMFRAQWPQAWAIRGLLEPAHDDPLRRAFDREPRHFGIQRYHVRIELYAGELDLVPTQRIRSWGADQLTARGDELPTVVATLPEPLDAVSRVFGLTQVDPLEPLSPEVEAQIEEMEGRELVFRRETVIERHLEASGTSFDQLVWQEGFLGNGRGPTWQEMVRPGDLVRVGERTVILYRGQDPAGALGEEDLALDFARGARVVPLSAIFAIPTLIQWAAVSPRGSPASPEPGDR